jgi:hypothetical protein
VRVFFILVFCSLIVGHNTSKSASGNPWSLSSITTVPAAVAAAFAAAAPPPSIYFSRQQKKWWQLLSSWFSYLAGFFTTTAAFNLDFCNSALQETGWTNARLKFSLYHVYVLSIKRDMFCNTIVSP